MTANVAQAVESLAEEDAVAGSSLMKGGAEAAVEVAEQAGAQVRAQAASARSSSQEWSRGRASSDSVSAAKILMQSH